MKAFLTTLFGDIRNCCVVAGLVLGEAAMVHGGLAREAAFAVPVLTLAGIFWLARPAR
jgi:hypothetical protein